MKINFFVCLSFCIILFLATGCTALSLPSQSEITSNTVDDKINNCILIVNKNDITSGNYVKLNQDYAELPFTAVMKALGAKVVWLNKTTANITYEDSIYILDTTECMLIKVGDNWNFLIPPPGGTRYYQVIEYELILDSVTMRSAFKLMGTNVKININYEEKIINIG